MGQDRSGHVPEDRLSGAYLDSALALVLPPNLLPPPEWRTRISEIRRRIADEGDDLTCRLRELQAAPSDIELKRELPALLRDYAGLFPGEDGGELVRSIVSGGVPQRSWYRADSDPAGEPVELFATPVRPYALPDHRRGGRKRKDDDINQLLALLRDGRTHAEIAHELGMTPTELHRELTRLRQRRGVVIEESLIQDVRASIRRGRLTGKAGRWFGYRRLPRLSGEVETLRFAELVELTGVAADELRQSRHVQTYTSIVGDAHEEMARVPIELLAEARRSRPQ